MRERPQSPVDPWAAFAATTGRSPDELPLNRPLTSRGEQVFVGVVAMLLVAVCATAFVADDGRTGVGWLLTAFSVTIVAALVWAHRRGGINRPLGKRAIDHGRDDHAVPAPALDPSVRPTTYAIASIHERVVGGVLEQLVAAVPILMLVMLDISGAIDASDVPLAGALALAVFVFGTTFEIWLTNGRTLGRRLAGTRVVRTDGLRMTFGVAAKREFFKMVNSQFFGIGYLSATVADPLQRSPADLRADTLVVRDP